MSSIGQVISSSPEKITIALSGLEVLESNKPQLQVGRFLKIEDGNHNFALASINNINGQKIEKDGQLSWSFIIESSPIGALVQDGDSKKFVRGVQVLPVPTELVHIIEDVDLALIFSNDGDYNFEIGRLSGNIDVRYSVDGNKFFGKHIGVVGSTGSGKSCAVASLIQKAVGISNSKNLNLTAQKNSHVLIFDLHDEYSSAFTIPENEKFNLNQLNSANLVLPYWLMNSEELESLFIESNENNSHNQVSQFKYAVIKNKERHNTNLNKITYDSPVYFDIGEVFNYICNKNNLTVYESVDGKKMLATKDVTIEFNENLLWEIINFEASTANAKHPDFNAKVKKEGGFNGEFERFISRFETKLNDSRLNFLLRPLKDDKEVYKTSDFEEILKQFLGYINKENITIVDLSGIPFDVLSLTVSLISRLMFDFAFHYTKLKHASNDTNNLPFLIVCEEAHNYIPRIGGAEYKASKKSLERIAKEGRKYGLSLMIVSQRPSEVSDTIFSQCNNFVSLRLTNKTDQGYVKALLPDNANGAVELLPSLGQGEAFIAGDAVLMPALIQLPMPSPEPKSASIASYNEWSKEWQDPTFSDVVNRWKLQF